MKLEYVASGMNHTRISRKNLKARAKVEGDPVIETINNILSALNGSENHAFSLLFNAYTEEGLANSINKVIYPGTLAELHADSGGLQMVTLGKTPNETMREKVYKTQAQYSTIAMSFDEIPVVISSDRSTRHDTSTRYFDRSLIKEKAVLSGENILTQIDYFNSTGNTKAKPLVIIQGNCFNTYQEWAYHIIETIGLDNLKYTGGVAFGAPALGNGVLEDFKRGFSMFNVELPPSFKNKHYHVLGVGAIVRLVPFFAMSRAGLIPETCTLSYDSTSHTSGLSMGNYWIGQTLGNLSKYKDKQFYAVLNDINKNLSILGIEPIEEDWLYKRVAAPSLWNESYSQDDEEIEYRTIFGMLASSILNFMHDVNALFTDDEVYKDYLVQRKLFGPTKAFTECTNGTEFNEWCKTFSRLIPSKPVKSVSEQPVSLFA